MHNAAEQWVDISYKSPKPSTYFMVEGADFDLFLLAGPTPKDVVRQFTALTGKADLPPVTLVKYFIMSIHMLFLLNLFSLFPQIFSPWFLFI